MKALINHDSVFGNTSKVAQAIGERYRPDIMGWLASLCRITRPVSEGAVASVLDISKIPSFSNRLKFRLSVLFGVWSEGDHRDWGAIHTWVDELPANLFGQS